MSAAGRRPVQGGDGVARPVRHPAVRVALGLFMLLISGLVLPTGSAKADDGLGRTDSPSKVTLSGSGRFSGLQVSVGQTKNLVNQVIDISWTGAATTLPEIGNTFAVNYLQVMQCWGGTVADDTQKLADGSEGPDRTQCQYGGNYSDNRGGNASTRRKVANVGPVDPKETIAFDGKDDNSRFVPFNSVTGVTSVGPVANQDFFNPATTNEINFARSRRDGSGMEFFEIQTDLEAPGLGCGRVMTLPSGVSHPRSCWLVIVPRDNVEVDGTTRAGGTSQTERLDSSPLSASNWANRLQVKLEFSALGSNCPLGAKERPTAGNEVMTEAISRWQPTLCAAGPVYGFSQVSDSVARRQLLTTQPGVEFLTTAVPGDQVSQGHSIEYAPVALSGLAVGFLLESQAGPNAPESLALSNGKRLADVKLDARLVAKLLTQSYGYGVDQVGGNTKYLQGSPSGLNQDPEFLKLNPSFADQALPLIGDVLMPLGLSDTTRQLWAWIESDQDARDFVNGLADPWGMRVSPFFQGMDIPRDDYPKLDPLCYPRQGQNYFGKTVTMSLCSLDQRPYAQDLHETTRSASRGDSLARTTWSGGDANTAPSWVKGSPQISGNRAILTITDTATAERYRLPMAQLQNAAGKFVAPTDTSLVAGVAAMKTTSVSNVLQPDPSTTDPDAYPLTTLTYAVTAPASLVVDSSTGTNEPKDYADLIRYAVNAGQVRGENPGNLPYGYVPLPDALRQQALTVADHVEAQRNAVPPTSTQTSTASSTTKTTFSPTAAASGSTSSVPVLAAPSPGASATPTPVTATSTPSISNISTTQRTPSLAATVARDVLGIVLLLGGSSAVLSPLLPWAARKLHR